MNWLTFTNPWLLGGLAAVGLPLLVHWLTRARPRRIAFPPFKFLVEAGAGQQAIHRLRTIILLVIRCLLVGALALLFARPFLKPAGVTANAQPTRRVVLVLDASLSMRAVQQGVPLFGRAQAEAAEVLRSLPVGSEAAVILEGATPHALLPALSENIPALHDLLIKSLPTYENGDPAAALALAQKMLNGNGTIYVFSDFQKSNWEGVGLLPAGATCRLRPVTTEAVDNVAITAARLVPAAPVIDEPAEILCTVFNCTSHPREETVRLEMGEFSRESRVTVAAFTSADTAFGVTFSRPGPVAGNVSLAPDNLREDNTRYVTANVGNALEVVLVSDADAADWNNSAFYISRALAPSPQAAPGIHLVRRRGQDLDRGILETADVFCLTAPATLSGEAQEIITRRVTEGARLIVFLDGPASGALMFPQLNPPFELLQSVTSTDGEGVAMNGRQNFGELEAGDFATPRFHRHIQTRAAEGRSSDTILAYADGSTALAACKPGHGAMIFVNLPLTPDGGDFIGNPIFPALLHELLRNLRQDSETESTPPGEPWTLDVPTAGEGALTVTDPDGKPMPATVLASGRHTRLSLPPAKSPGIHVVKQAGTAVAYTAINVDPRESDTRPLALENLKPGANAAVTIQHGEEDTPADAPARELWPHVLAGALVLLGLEMLLLTIWRTARTAPAAKPPEATA